MVYEKVYNNYMENSKILLAFDKQFKEKYYTARELEYGNEAGVFLSPFEYKDLLEFKDEMAPQNHPYLKLLPLTAFNYKCLYYSPCNELSSLLESYLSVTVQDDILSDRFSSSFLESMIYSEIEGSVNVENIPTTRRRLKELLEDGAPVENTNDIIIKNMKAGIDFVSDLPEFNEENLFKLYSILSENCLSEETELRPGDHYRYDTVEIANYHGCPVDKIEESLNSLFEFVYKILHKSTLNDKIMLPHICHYYLLYIHPYFDYNGRTARMVSYWVFLLCGLSYLPPIISEAINQTKSKYYQVLELSRDAHNDLTYFLNFLLGVSIDYFICYQDLVQIEQKTKNKGGVLTDTELNYIKRLLVSYSGVFTYLDFLKMANIDISKQGALKILNRFTEYGILKEVPSSSKFKLFDFNRDAVPFSLKTFGYKAF